MNPLVASVPSGHVYVRHLDPVDRPPTVTRLADPRPCADVPDAQWWPPRMLEPGWVDEHADEFDLMHIHFGFDAVSPEDLTELVSRLRHHGRPLVVTVHDLRNPHHHDRGLHDAQLGVLVEAADAVLTLTPGAAAEIARRWGRTAEIVPHPHVVDERRMAAPRPAHEGFVIGVHAKSLRAGMDPLPVVEEIVRTLPDLPDARLRVDAHTDVMSPENPRYASALAPRLRQLHDEGRLELHVHDYFTDDELWDYLQSLDVSVLPYRFGTHSGWLEACYDLGTTVVAPDCGHYADQRPCLTYAVPSHADAADRLSDGTPPALVSVPSLREALLTAHREQPAWRADVQQRRREREEIAAVHDRVYAAALAARAERSAACMS